ncbi:MAG: hypothetical protein WEB50_07165 [Vicinamibacterales bacterium]
MNQTKRFGDPSMDVYLCDGPRVHRVARGPYAEDGGGVAEHWRLDGDAAPRLRGEGLRVLRDDEPLAIAHAEVRAARERPPRRGRH